MKSVIVGLSLFVLLMFVLTDVVYAGTATITYTEPTLNEAGNPIISLKETTIFWKQDAGVEKIVKVPATAPGGGGSITRVITIVDPPVCGSTTITVQLTASNTNATNFESVRSIPPVTATKTASQVGCTTPNAPFNPTVTIQ